jgi:hypothetical protein
MAPIPIVVFGRKAEIASKVREDMMPQYEGTFLLFDNTYTFQHSEYIHFEASLYYQILYSQSRNIQSYTSTSLPNKAPPISLTYYPVPA